MSATIDRVLRHGMVSEFGRKNQIGIMSGEHVEPIKSHLDLAGMKFFDITDAATWWIKDTKNRLEHDPKFDPMVFPNLAPPFENWTMEFEMLHRFWPDVPPGRALLFFQGFDLDEVGPKIRVKNEEKGMQLFRRIMDAMHELPEAEAVSEERMTVAAWASTCNFDDQDSDLQTMPPGERRAMAVGRISALRSVLPVRWAVHVAACWEAQKGWVRGPLWEGIIPVLPDGTTPPGQPMYEIYRNFDYIRPNGQGLNQDDYNKFSMMIQARMVFPACFAISLLHCKNVTYTERRQPREVQHAAIKKYGKPPVRLATLDIKPMRKVLREEGGEHQVGVARAMSICRGHFKDYREHGLGKYHTKGIWWWDAHVRGSAEQGAVVKDYRVRSPVEAPSQEG